MFCFFLSNWVCRLDLSFQHRAVRLSVFDNSLEGSIPSEIGLLTSLGGCRTCWTLHFATISKTFATNLVCHFLLYFRLCRRMFVFWEQTHGDNSKRSRYDDKFGWVKHVSQSCFLRFICVLSLCFYWSFNFAVNLYLYDNRLTGTIPDEINSMTSFAGECGTLFFAKGT